MKILFIVENFYPNTSGVPVVVQYLAERLCMWGHNVSVLTRLMPKTTEYEELNGVHIYRKNISYGILKDYKGDKDGYIQFIMDFDADVNIFECSQCITTDIALSYIRSLRGKTLFHSHGFSGLTLKPFRKMSTWKNTIGNSYNWMRWQYYYRFVFCKYLNDFDAVFCLSEVDSSMEYLQKYYEKEVGILSNAADDMFFRPCSVKRINQYVDIIGEGYLLSVANYSAVKNQMGILKEYYLSDADQFDLVFVGGEKNYYYENLISYNEKLKKKYGERNVHFLVGVNRADIPSIMKSATLYLVGSTFEEFSISLIESMAEGLVFISTDTGNARVLPGGATINNLDMMHEKINDLIKDGNMRCYLADNGKKYAYENCRIDQVTKKLVEIVAVSNKG